MTLFQAFGQFAGQAAADEYAWELIVPSSVTYSGTSAGITTEGTINMSAVTTLSVNDCFPTTYKHFVVSLQTYVSTGSPTLEMRFRASGSDDSTANYDRQYIWYNGATIQLSQAENETEGWLSESNTTGYSHEWAYIQNPNQAVWTTWRTRNAWSLSNGSSLDVGGRHTVASAFDGFTILDPSADINGSMQVYGVRL